MTTHTAELEVEPGIASEHAVHDLEIAIDALGDHLTDIRGGEVSRIFEASRRLANFGGYLRARDTVAA